MLSTTLERVKQGLDSLVNGPSTGLDSLVNGSSTNAGTSTDATPLSALAEDDGLDTPELTQAAIRFAEAEQASAQTHLQSVVEALSPLEASLLELQAVTARIEPSDIGSVKSSPNSAASPKASRTSPPEKSEGSYSKS